MTETRERYIAAQEHVGRRCSRCGRAFGQRDMALIIGGELVCLACGLNGPPARPGPREFKYAHTTGG